MFERVIVEKLFGLFDYDIDLRPMSQYNVHFITAPNGYGKTTLLKMISSSILADFEVLFDIPFVSFKLFWDNVSLTIDRKEKKPEQTEDTDIAQAPEISLYISLIHGQNIVESMELKSGRFNNDFNDDFQKNIRNSNIEMYLKSFNCDHITDDRLLIRKSDDNDSERLDMNKFSLTRYVEKIKRILFDPIETDLYSERISFFKKTVDSLGFSMKEMELSKYFGIRFTSKSADKDIIPVDKLSSGEKHILIQLCEMLFEAKMGTLVLIDEPELSLHMAWQFQYLKMIEGIANLCGFQIIVATHSPQIFNSEWSLTTDLYSLTSNN